MPRHIATKALAAWTTAFLVGLVSSCSGIEEVTPIVLECAVPTCSTETGACVAECSPTDDVCPGGTACRQVDVTCSPGSRCERTYQCRPVPTRLSAPVDGLAPALGVGTFPLNQLPDDGSGLAKFAWSRPRDALVVKCMVFSCEPRLRRVGSQDGRPVVDVINANDCIIGDATTAFDADDETSLDLEVIFAPADVASVLVPPDSCARQARTRSYFGSFTSSVLLTELSVGCIAYGEGEVVAATPLVPFTPEGFPNHPSELPRLDCADEREVPCVRTNGALGECDRLGECVSSRTRPSRHLAVRDCDFPNRLTDGVGCFEAPSGGMGNCLERECRDRCLDSGDCPYVDRLGQLECCRLRSRSYLGLCLPPGACGLQ